MAKNSRKKTTPKRSGKQSQASPEWLESLKKTSRKSWVAAFAIVFWGGVFWLWSLRETEVSTGRQDRELAIETRLFLREINIALDNYHSVHGIYPVCPNESQGAEVLFQKLLAGSPRFLGPRPGRIRKNEDGESPEITDSWGHPIRYRTGSPPGQGVTPKPEYDLWSTGGDPENPREKWILP
jgi:hypothetical protein